MKSQVDVVVKFGGALMRDPAAFGMVATAIVDAAALRRVVVVPGGGLFADAVRALDQQLKLSADVTHWMAIRAMDAYACLLAERLDGDVVSSLSAIARVQFAGGRCAVLAPYEWLRAEDPLPHSWDVTSDSIAVWVAAQLHATRLVLVKPPAARAPLTDPFFAQVPSDGVERVVVTADRVDDLRHALGAPALQGLSGSRGA